MMYIVEFFFSVSIVMELAIQRKSAVTKPAQLVEIVRQGKLII